VQESVNYIAQISISVQESVNYIAQISTSVQDSVNYIALGTGPIDSTLTPGM
jgi:hypothetical protein